MLTVLEGSADSGKYRDWSWDAFLAINKTTRAGSGYSGISNVNVAGGGSFDDVQESFFLAEVLKYSYLTQTDGELPPIPPRKTLRREANIWGTDAEWQVNSQGDNAFVFNTEAHPLRVAA
jgi:mannosyl-oligosaccharide alpha-1,2-mannosidase